MSEMDEDEHFDNDGGAGAARNARPVRRALAPPYYYGRRNDNPQTFIAAFDQIANSNSWDDNMKLVQFPSYLRGFAQAWMQGLQRRVRRGDLEAPSWEELVRLFLLQATEGLYADSEESLLYSRTQREDESLLGYLYNIDTLCDRVDPDMTDERRLFFVKKGLKPEYFKEVNLQRVNTVDGMRQLFTKLSENEDKCKGIDSLTKDLKSLDIFNAEVDEKKEGSAEREMVLFGDKNLKATGERPALSGPGGHNAFGRSFLPKTRKGVEVSFVAELEDRLKMVENALVLSANNRPHTNGYPRVPPRRDPPRLPPPIQCWRCNRYGHIASECPQQRQGGNPDNQGSRGGFNPDRRASYLANPFNKHLTTDQYAGPRAVYSAQGGPNRSSGGNHTERYQGHGGAYTEFVWNTRHPANQNHSCRLCGKDHPFNRCPFRLENPVPKNECSREERSQAPSASPARH